VLAVSSQRGVAGGVSFGHGEVFRSKEGRLYLFIHRKDAKPDWWFHRIPVLKELSFDEATGEMLPLVDGATDPRQDLNVFLTPRQMY